MTKGVFTDLTGQRFGKLVVIKKVDKPKDKNFSTGFWLCLCDCGNEKIITSGNLKNGKTQSCGCLKRDWTENIVGLEINRLTVLDQYYKFDGKRDRLYCKCLCTCGTIFETRYNEVKNGKTISCGCYQKEQTSKQNTYFLDGEYGIGIANNTKNKFYFDLDDYELIKDIGWHETDEGYLCGRLGNKVIKIHRLITGFSKEKTDHINRNKLDNRKENFRVATNMENSRNRSVAKNNKFGITGVCFNKSRNKYSSYLYINHFRVDLGYYKNLDDAITARLNGEKEYFGEFSPQRHLFEQYGITNE